MKINKSSRKPLFLLISLVVLIIPFTTLSQNVYGIKGFVKIPDAEINDGHFSAGVFLINNNHVFDLKFNDEQLLGNSTLVYYASLGFLPFIEMSFRGTKIGTRGEALGDRMLNLKIKLSSERSEFFPSISLGMNDVSQSRNEVETQNFHSTYLVLTKNIDSYFPIKIVFGYGIKIFKSKSYDLLGCWYGIGVYPMVNSRISLEYDAKYVNVGFDYKIFDMIKLSFHYYRIKYIGIGCNIDCAL